MSLSLFPSNATAFIPHAVSTVSAGIATGASRVASWVGNTASSLTNQLVDGNEENHSGSDRYFADMLLTVLSATGAAYVGYKAAKGLFNYFSGCSKELKVVEWVSPSGYNAEDTLISALDRLDSLKTINRPDHLNDELDSNIFQSGCTISIYMQPPHRKAFEIEPFWNQAWSSSSARVGSEQQLQAITREQLRQPHAEFVHPVEFSLEKPTRQSIESKERELGAAGSFLAIADADTRH